MNEELNMNNYIKVNTEFFNTDLKPLEILMLAVIESFTRENKDCYYTNVQWAEMFSVTEKTIRNTLDTLEARNYIKRNTKTIRDREGNYTRQRTIELVHLKVQKFQGFSF